MNTPSIHFPATGDILSTYLHQTAELPCLHLRPNDSPIHRGDREDTGDEEARPDEMGSGPATPTVDPTSFGGTSSIRHPTSEHFEIEQEKRDTDGFEVMVPTDGRLGLTDIEDVAPDDWAANIGETRTPEGSEP